MALRAGKTADAFQWLDLRLREAASTLQCFPLSRHDKPDGHGSYWPRVVRSIRDAYGYDGDPKHPDIPKDTDEQKRRREERLNRRVTAIQRGRISRMKEALDWMRWLTGDEYRLVWGRAEGISWEQLRDQRSIRTLQRVRDNALGAILIRLYG